MVAFLSLLFQTEYLQNVINEIIACVKFFYVASLGTKKKY
jgi:hypothetical protein